MAAIQNSILLNTIFSYRKDHPLAYRVLTLFLFFSVVLVILTTAVRVTTDYKTEQNNIQNRLNLIASSQIDGITKSLWNLDQEQISLQLKGIMNFPDILAVTLDAPDWSQPFLLGNVPAIQKNNRRASDNFSIVYTTIRGTERKLGTLTIYHDIYAINHRLFESALWSLISQSILILITGIILLVVVHFNITRHLERMASFAKELGRGHLSEHLLLNRSDQNYSDELDQVVDAINEMRTEILKDIARRELEEQELRYSRDQLQEQVERRTKNLLEAKDAAEMASKAKSKFLATMSHEIRTPLNGILGMVQLMSRTSLSSDQKQRLNTIYQSGDALLEILNGLLDYARLEEGAYTPELQSLSLYQLVETSCHLFSARALEKGLTLEFKIDDDVHDYCLGPTGALRQILSNLISNAVKFTEAGRVSVELEWLALEEHRQWVRFSVKDSGIGIAREDINRIFERFSQADESITRRFGGTGLGLAISQKLVRTIDGEIGVDSEVGAGSEFWFEVPLTIDLEHHTENKDLVQIASHTSIQPLKILLVEDMPVNQEVTLSLLACDGHNVSLAKDGYEANDILAVEKFDVVLMDVHLPGISGLDVSRQIKANNGPNKTTPIIALTANVQPANIQEYHAAGMIEVVPKPLKLNMLYDAIGIAMAGSVDESDSVVVEKDGQYVDVAVFKSHASILGVSRAKNLVQTFSKSCSKIVPLIAYAIKLKDYYDIREQSHRLAGDAESIGAQWLATHLRNLEDLTSGNASLQEIEEQFALMSTGVERTFEQLHSLIGALE